MECKDGRIVKVVGGEAIDQAPDHLLALAPVKAVLEIEFVGVARLADQLVVPFGAVVIELQPHFGGVGKGVAPAPLQMAAGQAGVVFDQFARRAG